MVNFNRPYGSNKVTRTTDDNDTPQQKKFEASTGKDSDGAVGDVDRKEAVKTSPAVSGVKSPSGVDEKLWAEAEASALGVSGGFAGVGPEGRKQQIQDQYDKMVASDKQTKEWAGGSGILGDIGDDKPKED